ncbi:MAG: hypothetical protein FWG53_09910 [Clostridiales bacterium]|nr:hypothetical protein [Clostridiales bacterium]
MEGTKNFAWPVTAVSKEDFDVVRSCVASSGNLFRDKKIMIFGAGIRGSLISVILEAEGFTNILFTDNNPDKWGGCIDNHPIVPPEAAISMRGETVIVISTEEGDPIKAQLEKAGLVEGVDFLFPKTDLYDKFAGEFERKAENGILAMGDCMFEVVSFHDVNKQSLAEMIFERLGNENIKLLTMHGMGMRSFYHILKAQSAMGMRPGIFVVMINFETLTDKQHLLPRSQHSKLMRRLSDIVKGVDGGELSEYACITEQRVKNVQAEFFTTNKQKSAPYTNSTGDISIKAARLFFKLHYMYKLDPNTENLEYLAKVFEFAQAEGFHVIPFVPPVNYELGESLFGEAFQAAYRRNFKIVDDLTKKYNCDLLDLSHLCTKELFSGSFTPDETTNCEGRQKIADKITREIERVRNGCIKREQIGFGDIERNTRLRRC